MKSNGAVILRKFWVPGLVILAAFIGTAAEASSIQLASYSVNVDSGGLILPSPNGDSIGFSDPTNQVACQGNGCDLSLLNTYVLTFTPNPGRAFSAFYMGAYTNVYGGYFYDIVLSYSIAGAGSDSAEIAGYNFGTSQSIVLPPDPHGYPPGNQYPGIAVPASGFTVTVDSYLHVVNNIENMGNFGFSAVTTDAPTPTPEPSSLALLAMGLCGSLLFARGMLNRRLR